MNDKYIEQLVAEWSDVYKKGQLSLWTLLAVADGRKYAAQITEYMSNVTGGAFEVKEQSLYRALRRFEKMKLLSVSTEDSPNSGTKRKYFELTDVGNKVLSEFISVNISPLYNSSVRDLIENIRKENN